MLGRLIRGHLSRHRTTSVAALLARLETAEV